MSARALLPLSLLLAVGCGSNADPEGERDGDASEDGGLRDSGRDGGPQDAGRDGGSRDGGGDGGSEPEPCSTPGATTCSSDGRGRQCCGGHWYEFFDGPCWETPMTECDPELPQAGCPCEEEEAIGCPQYQWRLICTDGVWEDDVGWVCCD